MSVVTVLRAMAQAGIPHERILELIAQEEADLAELRRALVEEHAAKEPLRAAIRQAFEEPDRRKATALLRDAFTQAHREGGQ